MSKPTAYDILTELVKNTGGTLGYGRHRKQALTALEELMLDVIYTSKNVYYVKGKVKDTDRYIEIREELREEQRNRLKERLT